MQQQRQSPVRNSYLSAKYTRALQRVLSPELGKIFGYNALLYSPLADQLCNKKLTIKQQLTITELLANNKNQKNHPADVYCDFSQLPFLSDSIDLAVLPNILQSSEQPQKILREVERVLIAEGVVIIIGRNPFSYVGVKAAFDRQLIRITHLFGSNQQAHQEKSTRVIKSDFSRQRITDWFGLLGLETKKQLSVSLTHQAIAHSQAYPWLKKCAQLFCDCFCSHYIIIGVKKVSTLTPIRPSWRSNKQLLPSRLAEPSVKVQVDER